MIEAVLIGSMVGSSIVAVVVRLWEGEWDDITVGFALGCAFCSAVGVMV